MANYDASIRVSTKIDIKNAEIQLSTLENRIVKTSDEIASLRSKMDALKDQKIPTQEYSEITAQIRKAETEFNKLLEKQEQMQREGKDNGKVWDRLNEKMEEAGNTIRYAQGELQDLVDTGKAFTLGSDTEEFSKLGQQLKYKERNLDVLTQKHDVLESKIQQIAKDGYKKLGDVAKRSFNSVGNFLKKANSTVDSFGRRIKEIAQRHMPHFRKEADRTGSSLSKFNSRLKSLLSGIFIFNVISAGFRKMFSGAGEGFKNFYSESSAFSSSIDNMRQSLSYLQNSFAAAFAPIVEIAIPYIQKLINYMAGAVNAVAQLIAALFGKKTYMKAIGTAAKAMDNVGSSADKSNKAISSTSSALNNVADSAREAQDALEGYLSPLDEINPYKTSKGNSSFLGNLSGGIQNPSTGSQPGNAAGSQFGEYLENMFEEIPVDSIFEKMAKKIKDVFSKLFAPLKEAWNREGKFVMDSWKSALKEVWNLVKSVGSDFLEVWQQEKTVKIFEDILHIIGDIGQVVSHLAHNFRVAWEENETGKRILEGVRDIIGVIVANIRHAADATVSWAKNINFTPLLTKVKQWVASMIPVMDNLSGIVTDFYEHVLLPLGKWVLEKGLPDLLQVFIDFNNRVDWEALRERLAEFWKYLEPFAEKVGEGLIIFIGRLADALANFINSPAFEGFLTILENWMDNAEPEKIADTLEFIAKAIISLKVAVVGFSAVSNGISMLLKLSDALKLFSSGGGISSALAGLKTIGTTIAGWAPHIAVGGAIVTVIKQIKKEVAERVDTKGFGLTDWISATLELSLQSWKQKFEGFRVSMEIWWSESWMSDKIWKFGQWWSEKVSPWFTREKWAGLWNNISVSLNSFSTQFQNKWSNLWSTMQSRVSSTLQNIKSGIQSAFEWIKEKVKGIQDALSGIFSSSKKSTSGFGKGSSFLPSSQSRTAANPVYAKLADIPIPGYATGQVIPRTMKQHLAILGDNTQETEVVSPISTMKQAFMEALGEMGGMGGNGQPIILKVILDSKEILYAMVKEGKIVQMSTGKNIFALE
ncbi:MAG: hypothetical protein K1W10_02360 [Lachnospiraceae bacterium]